MPFLSWPLHMSLVMPANQTGLNPFTERWAATSPSDTKEEALAKERAFQEAQKNSREIDELLLESKKALDKKKKSAQILLLGKHNILSLLYSIY